jgi:hypothetical protein
MKRKRNDARWREQLLMPGHFGSSLILLISFCNLRVKIVTPFCSQFLSRVFNYIERLLMNPKFYIKAFGRKCFTSIYPMQPSLAYVSIFHAPFYYSFVFWIDLSPFEWNFDLDKNFITAWKSITKLVIFRSFVAKCCQMRII